MAIIALGDSLTFQGPGTTQFVVRVNPANGEIDIIYEDTATGETWAADTVIRQSVIGMERSRSMRLDWLSLDSENPFEVGGALDTATFGFSRHVPGRTPIPYDAIWALVFVGDDNAGGVKNQQYGAVTSRIWNPIPDAYGHAQGEMRIAGNGFDSHQGWMGLAKGLILTNGDRAYPNGGYLGFGTWNVPASGGYFVDGNRVDRQTINLGSAYVIAPNQTHWFGPGYDADYATGASWLSAHAGVLRNLVVRLPSPPVGTVTAVIQRQYADTTVSVTLSGSSQQVFIGGGLQIGAGEAIGLKVTMDANCVPQGGIKACFDYGA